MTVVVVVLLALLAFTGGISGELGGLVSGRLVSSAGTAKKAIYVNGKLSAYSTVDGQFQFQTDLDSGLITVWSLPGSHALDYEQHWESYAFHRKNNGGGFQFRRAPLDVQYPLESSVQLSDTLLISPIVASSGGSVRVKYFLPRESFSILTLLSNPMVLMMLVTFGMMGAMNYLNPLAAEAQQQQKQSRQQLKQQ